MILQMACEADEDCAKQTILPMYCVGKVCQRKHCDYHKDCPKGFGCYNDGFCKRVSLITQMTLIDFFLSFLELWKMRI